MTSTEIREVRGDSGPPRPSAPARATQEAAGISRVADVTEASQIHGKGAYGTIQGGGALYLDDVETTYLVESGRLRVADPAGHDLGFQDLVRLHHRRDRSFEIRYLVYRDFRQRGYIVRSGTAPFDFGVLPRGGSLSRTPSRYWVRALSERTSFQLPEILDLLDRARAAKRTLLVGVVDEESDLTYYRVREVSPRGHLSTVDMPKEVAGTFLEDRVSIFDPVAAEILGERAFFGCRVGSRLELSLLEAVYLAEEGVLSLQEGPGRRPLSREQLLRRALRVEPDIPRRLPVYRHLRSVGLVPKTGFKYGTHFRAYERHPATSHARYLLHVVPPDFETLWPEVSRGVRLAQGVRKEFLFAWASGPSGPRYMHLERVRP